MTEAVLDASALIAFLRNEPGADRVAGVLTRSCISAVNLAETLGKMVEHGRPLEAVVHQVLRLRIPVVPFDAEQARLATSLWKGPRSAGLCIGDRACLALASQSGAAAYTTNDEWLNCDTGVRVVKIR